MPLSALTALLPPPAAGPAPTSPTGPAAPGEGAGPSFAQLLGATDTRRAAPFSGSGAADGGPGAASATEAVGPGPQAETGPGLAPDAAPVDALLDGSDDDRPDAHAADPADATRLLADLAAMGSAAPALTPTLTAAPAPAHGASAAAAAGPAADTARSHGTPPRGRVVAGGAREGAEAGAAAQSSLAAPAPGAARDPASTAGPAAGAAQAKADRPRLSASPDPAPGAAGAERARAFTRALGEAASRASADAGVAGPSADGQASAATEPRPGARVDPVPLAAAGFTAALPGAAPAGSAAAAEARLPSPPGTAAFTAELGAQVTTFVRDGVQHARLELHPLELGPVTVQIALEGAEARVHLAAEHAGTRQALEQALPALAGHLREAGFTLSGGGVFEQAAQAQGDGGRPGGGRPGGEPSARDSGSRPATAGDAEPAARTAAPRRRGVVDLVA